jgi:DNA-binding transcriptional LysR family regulator
MELSHLRYFLHVAQSGSFNRGARRAHVSAPAMTKAIQKLEDELGARLFERTTRRVTLTEAGLAVLARARAAIHQVEDIARDLEELEDTVAGELRIGAMEVFSIRVLPRSISALVAEHPKVRPIAYEMHPESIERALAEGLLDVGLTIGAPGSKEVNAERLGRSPGRIVCGRGHPLYRSRRISRAALLEHAFVVPRFFQREHLPSLDQFPEDRYPRRVGATIELLQMMVELTIAGTYLGYFPELSVAHHLATRDLVSLRGLTDLPSFDLWAWTRQGTTPKRAVAHLLRAVEAVLAHRRP